MAEMLEKTWWAQQGLNLRPLRCQHRRYSPVARISADRGVKKARTGVERTGNIGLCYRSFTAPVTA